jgi:hypothetical protein
VKLKREAGTKFYLLGIYGQECILSGTETGGVPKLRGRSLHAKIDKGALCPAGLYLTFLQIVDLSSIS